MELGCFSKETQEHQKRDQNGTIFASLPDPLNRVKYNYTCNTVFDAFRTDPGFDRFWPKWPKWVKTGPKGWKIDHFGPLFRPQKEVLGGPEP